MSQPPDAPDPYLPRPEGQQPYPQPNPQQAYQQPYPQQAYQQPYQQTWAGASDPTGGRSQDEVRRDRPTTVVRLVQLMWAGTVLAVLVGAYGLLSLDSAVEEATTEVEQDMVGSGLDPGAFAEVMGPVALVTVLLTTLVVAGLWGLFAWLLGRGQGRVVATVLGAVNGLATLGGLFFTVDLVELLLQLLTLAVVVGALVLLWLPTTSAWFRAVAAAGRSTSWG